MQQLPPALAPFAAYTQFCLYKSVPSQSRPGKTDKFPCDITGTVMSAHNPAIWMDAQAAIDTAKLFGAPYGVGFVFTANDPFYFVDLDDCLEPNGVTWSPVAVDIMTRLNGAAIEVSQSGKGLHVFGTGTCPEHGCKNIPLGLEFYTEGRFVALTGANTMGSASADSSAALGALVADYFSVSAGNAKGQDWTTEPCAEYTGQKWTDAELIDKALNTGTGAAAAFGSKATFKDLWGCNEDVLVAAYPDPRGYDASSADAALAQHLAFWTGNNCERILALMKQSELVRDKWDREDYLDRTIKKAVSMQTSVYSIQAADNSLAESVGACKIKGVSDSQANLAEGVRALKLAEAKDDPELVFQLSQLSSARFWLDNKDCTPAEMVAKTKPIERAAKPVTGDPEISVGYQLLDATGQIEHFRGCTYIQSVHKVFIPSGKMLRPDQFNSTFGGYNFQTQSEDSSKTTKKAWEAFTESQLVRYPQAQDEAFRPNMTAGAIFTEEGISFVNTYVPVEVERKVGDATPFLDHLAKLLPDQGDRDILLAYMAAIVQFKGVKFQWCPLIQGVEGNGKTLFTRCVKAAVGAKYTHLPPAKEIAEKFNDWLFHKLFIGVEDIYLPESKQEVIEVLKPMITNPQLAMRAMQQSQVMGDNVANFILNSNHRDGVRKTENDRRFCMLYTAQQNKSDIARDGMAGSYFPDLYDWLNGGGYAIVTEYLHTYAIPDALNPAGACHRAPVTTSTQSAINESLGMVEQSIEEAIQEGRPGFAGGWVSSVHLDILLKEIRRTVPPRRRREVLQSLGYDWHPYLNLGRAHNPISLDLGKKSILFIKGGHISANVQRGADIARAYQDAQAAASDTSGKAAEVFQMGVKV